MPHLKKDKALMLGFKQGHRESLDAVYRAYAPPLRARVRALLRTAPPVLVARLGTDSDIVHDAFARAFTHAARQAYDGTRNYGPYLHTIAKNLITDTIRRCNRELAANAWGLSEEETFEHPAGYGDTLTVIRAYLDSLPEPLRAVYHQRFVVGESQRCASAALGVERGTLRVREAQLMRGLRQTLQARGLLDTASHLLIAP